MLPIPAKSSDESILKFESDPLIQRLEWLDSATGPMRWVCEKEDGLSGAFSYETEVDSAKEA